jgi:hypothetical protein
LFVIFLSPLSKLTGKKKKRERKPINLIRNENGAITTDTTEVYRIIGPIMNSMQSMAEK